MNKTKSIQDVVYFLMRVSLVQITMMITFATLVCAADINGQQVLERKVTINVINEDIITVLAKLEKQAMVSFTYSPEVIMQANSKVSMKVNNVSLGSVFEKLFGTSIQFLVKENEIILKPKRETASLNSSGVIEDEFAIRVAGKVTDESGQPLPGVNVVEKGTTNGTSTDSYGDYVLSITDKNSILTFSFIGYQNKEVLVGDQTTIDVLMKTEVISLGEVVVVGYGTQEKRDVTGSVGSVAVDDLKSLPVPSISDAMQGRVAGLQVLSSGVPGADATFRIRGTSTFNNSSPLLVIDGVPVSSGLNTLNPDDIESIQVLKDASAAAVYGSRGANGVIIVTTKRGKGKKSSLNLNYYYAVQEPTNMVEMLNASQFAALNNEMLQNNGLATNPEYADPASLGEGTDWLDALFHTAPMQNYSVSYSGSTEKSNYYVSGNVLNQDGIIINTGFKRYTLQFNSDYTVFDRVRFGNNLTLNHDVKTSGAYDVQNTMAALPVQPILNSDGTYSGPSGLPQWYGDVTNPIGQAELIKNSTKGYNLIGSIYGEADILKNLVFKSIAGLQANFWDDRTWSPKYDWKPLPQPFSTLNQSSNKSFTWLWDNTLTYTTSIKDVHDITALAGISAQHNNFDFIGGYREGFASDVTQQLNSGSQTNMASYGNGSAWSLLSFIGRVNYAFKDKYLLTATVRRDGSSRFGETNRYGTFPSVSAAWRISNEDFFNGVELFDDLKIRGGYGETGNQEIGNYSFASVLQTGSYNFNGQLVQTTYPQAMPNPNVRWESVMQANLGFDASLLNNRIGITFDAFVKNTENMLVRGAVPISTGYRDYAFGQDLRPFVNAGKMRNSGVEVSVNTNNLNGAFTWNTSLNFTFIRNQIVNLNDTVPLPAGQIDGNINYYVALQQNGHPYNAFFGYVTNGIFQTQEEVDAYATQQPGDDAFNRTSPGDIRFKDLNNDGRIDDEDRTFIGNPNPKFIFALNNTFAWKGFDLSIFVQGLAGHKIFNANRIWQEGMSVAQNQTTAVLDRWTPENTGASIPRAIYNDPNKNSRGSDRFIEDGSYVRIKNVTLGYTLPKAYTEKLKLTTARIYASGQNLYTFTNYSGIDPEVGVNGIDFNVYPVTRTISFGVNVSF